MPTSTARAQWEGPVTDGDGTVAPGGGAFRSPYSWRSRFEQGAGTNPEELIAAAHARSDRMRPWWWHVMPAPPWRCSSAAAG